MFQFWLWVKIHRRHAAVFKKLCKHLSLYSDLSFVYSIINQFDKGPLKKCNIYLIEIPEQNGCPLVYFVQLHASFQMKQGTGLFIYAESVDSAS